MGGISVSATLVKKNALPQSSDRITRQSQSPAVTVKGFDIAMLVLACADAGFGQARPAAATRFVKSLVKQALYSGGKQSMTLINDVSLD
jgi:hypothetical protein